jgi:hypothetical protein
MEPRPFDDKAQKPTGQGIQTALGGAYPYCQKVIEFTHAFLHEWTFTKGSGWMLKVYDRKKALLYLIPLDGAFKISLAIRENEREALLGDEALGSLHAQILSAKKYREGFALQFEIAGPNEFSPVELFLSKLISLRT